MWWPAAVLVVESAGCGPSAGSIGDMKRDGKLANWSEGASQYRNRLIEPYLIFCSFDSAQHMHTGKLLLHVFRLLAILRTALYAAPRYFILLIISYSADLRGYDKQTRSSQGSIG